MLAGTFSKEDSEQLKQYDIDSIILLEDQNLNSYNPLYFIEALNQLMKSLTPNLIIFGHTYETRDWVPRLSARTNTPVISDCISMNIENDIIFTRSLYQNKVNVDIKSKSDSTIISFQSGAYKLDSIRSGSASIDINSVDGHEESVWEHDKRFFQKLWRGAEAEEQKGWSDIKDKWSHLKGKYITPLIVSGITEIFEVIFIKYIIFIKSNYILLCIKIY